MVGVCSSSVCNTVLFWHVLNPKWWILLWCTIIYIYVLFFWQAVQDSGSTLMQECELNRDGVQQRLDQLAYNWDELKNLAQDR